MISTNVQECYSLTKLLYELSRQELKEEDRDEVIANISKLLNQRETLLLQIQPPYSDEEKQLGKQIVEMNDAISIGFKKLTQDIQLDIKEIKNKKKSAQKYTNPYQSLQSDGVYYDKKN